MHSSTPKPTRVKTWRNVHVNYELAAKPLGSPNGIAWAGGPWQNCAGADTNTVSGRLDEFAHADADRIFANFRGQVEAII